MSFVTFNQDKKRKVIESLRKSSSRLDLSYYGKQTQMDKEFFDLRESFLSDLINVNTEAELKDKIDKFRKDNLELLKKWKDIEPVSSLVFHRSKFTANNIESSLTSGFFNDLNTDNFISKITEGQKWLSKKIINTALEADKKINFFIFKIKKGISFRNNEDIFNEKLIEFQEKFGFKSVMIEKDASFSDRVLWLTQMDSALTNLAKKLNLPNKMMSLEGDVTISYGHNYLNDYVASGVAHSGHTIEINFHTISSLSETWLHELAHIVDYKAGLKYKSIADKEGQEFNEINNFNAPNVLPATHISEIIALESSGLSFLQRKGLHQSYMVDQNSENQKIRNLFGTVLGYKNFEDHQESSVWEHYAKVQDDLAKVLLVEILKNTDIDYVSLSVNEKNDLRNDNLSTLVEHILYSTIENSNFNMKDIKISMTNYLNKLKEEHPFHPFVEEITRFDSDKMNLLIDKIIGQNKRIKSSLLKVVENNNLILTTGYYGNFGFFSESEHVKKVFSASKSRSFENRNSTYYAKPTEIFARHIESIVKSSGSTYYQKYNQEDKEKAIEMFKNLLEYSGYDVTNIKENDLVMPQKDKFEKIIANIDILSSDENEAEANNKLTLK